MPPIKPQGWMTHAVGGLIIAAAVYGIVTGEMESFDSIFRLGEGLGIIAARNAFSKLLKR